MRFPQVSLFVLINTNFYQRVDGSNPSGLTTLYKKKKLFYCAVFETFIGGPNQTVLGDGTPSSAGQAGKRQVS